MKSLNETAVGHEMDGDRGGDPSLEFNVQ